MTTVRAPVLGALEVARSVVGERARAGLWPGLVLPDPLPPGWLPAYELLDPDRPALSALLSATGRRYRVPPHAAAALAWKAYSYWVALPAVLGHVLDGRVPRVDLERVAVRLSDERPYVTVGLTRLDTAPSGGPELRTWLVGGHLAPLAAVLRNRTRVGDRPLWGSLAENLVHPLVTLRSVLRRDVRVEAAELLAAVGPATEGLVDLVDGDDGPRVVRHTCCLAFTGPDLGFCRSCCVEHPNRFH